MVKYATALNILRQAGFFITSRACEHRMAYKGFKTNKMGYTALVANQEQYVVLDRGYVGFLFSVSWKSLNGNLRSLSTVYQREWVAFRTPPGNPPFTQANANAVMQFVHGGGIGMDFGVNTDEHSIKALQLTCVYPRVQGEYTAEQWYQYSFDNVTWKNIPQAAYLITRGVRFSGGEWVYYFRKRNWQVHNPVDWCFEAEVPIGPPPPHPPVLGQQWQMVSGANADLNQYGGRIVRMS